MIQDLIQFCFQEFSYSVLLEDLKKVLFNETQFNVSRSLCFELLKLVLEKRESATWSKGGHLLEQDEEGLLDLVLNVSFCSCGTL